MSQITPAQQTLYQRSKNWLNLHDDELKRKTVKAAATHDHTTLLELHEAWLTLHARQGINTSKRTLETYRNGITKYLEYAKDNAINILHPHRHAARGYVAELQHAGYSPAGIQLRISAANSLYAALRWTLASESDPWKDIKIHSDSTSSLVRHPPYTNQEISAVLAQCDTQQRTLLLLAAHTGLRVQEILNLRWQDINTQTQRLHVRGKGNKERTVVISDRLNYSLKAWRQESRAEHDKRRVTPPEAVFSYATNQTARYHLSQAFKKAGVKFRGLHAGRKYAGTKLIQQVGDFGRVAQHLGHASSETTRKHYAALPEDDLEQQMRNW